MTKNITQKLKDDFNNLVFEHINNNKAIACGSIPKIVVPLFELLLELGNGLYTLTDLRKKLQIYGVDKGNSQQRISNSLSILQQLGYIEFSAQRNAGVAIKLIKIN